MRGEEGRERGGGTGEGRRDGRGEEGRERGGGTGEGRRDGRGEEGRERGGGTGEGRRDGRGEGWERGGGTGEGTRPGTMTGNPCIHSTGFNLPKLHVSFLLQLTVDMYVFQEILQI